MVVKGKDVTEAIKGEIAKKIDGCGSRKPCLGIVRIGENPSDISYERGTIKTCEGLGLLVKVFAFDADIRNDDFVYEFKKINEDDSVDGILVFRPLPEWIDEEAICNMIDPKKDMDCMSPVNQAKILTGDKSGYYPCTAEAVIRCIEHTKIDLTGKKAVVLGRSMVIGKPVGLMMLDKNATVTYCHSKTKDIKEALRDADVIVSAVGRADFVTKDMIEFASKNVSIFDVGINFKDGKLCGDVSFDEVEPCCENITPVPGGVGSVTNVILAEHVVRAAIS